MERWAVRRKLTAALWRVFSWRFVGESTESRAGILIGAPHTSNWDYVAMLAICWRSGISPKFLGKKELFSGPMGVLARLSGGIPVDRDNPHALVSELVELVRHGDEFFLVIAPEGTRAKKDYWKSGFYRLAEDTGLPVTLGFIDRATKTAGWGPTLHVTGDVAADMQILRDFYADKGGVHPANKTEPRFRVERLTRAALARKKAADSAPES